MEGFIENDWRYTGQDKYLREVTLKYCTYHKRLPDHEHCEFCFARFSELDKDLHSGYATVDEYHWICEKCFQDFKELFNWKCITKE